MENLRRLIAGYLGYVLIFTYIFGLLTGCFLFYVVILPKYKVSTDEMGEDINSFIEDSEDESSSSDALSIVDLAGAINKPGIYSLVAGSRVADVLLLGEGFLTEASGHWVSRHINLSKKIYDGMKIYVPFEWEFEGACEEIKAEEVVEFPDISQESTSSNEGSGSSTASNSTLINVNTASLSALDTLPGIGPSYAQRIIDNRLYKDLSEFKTKSKIPSSTVDKLKDLITF